VQEKPTTLNFTIFSGKKGVFFLETGECFQENAGKQLCGNFLVLKQKPCIFYVLV